MVRDPLFEGPLVLVFRARFPWEDLLYEKELLHDALFRDVEKQNGFPFGASTGSRFVQEER